MSDQESNDEEDYANTEYIPVVPRSPSRYLDDFDEEEYEDYSLNAEHVLPAPVPEEITIEAREELSELTKATSEGVSKKRKGTKSVPESEIKSRRGSSAPRVEGEVRNGSLPSDGMKSAMRSVKERLKNAKTLSWESGGDRSSDLREHLTHIKTSKKKNLHNDEEGLLETHGANTATAPSEARKTRSAKKASQKEVEIVGRRNNEGEKEVEVSEDSEDEVIEKVREPPPNERKRRGDHSPVTPKKFHDAIDKINSRLDDAGAVQDKIRSDLEYLMGIADKGILKENSSPYQLIRPDNPHQVKTMGTLGGIPAFNIPQTFPGPVPGMSLGSLMSDRKESTSVGASILDKLRMAKLRLGQSRAAEPASNSNSDEEDEDGCMVIDKGKA